MEIKVEGYGYMFSCNGCSRRSLIGNPKYKIAKDLKDKGWKIERNGLSWCPKCSQQDSTPKDRP